MTYPNLLDPTLRSTRALMNTLLLLQVHRVRLTSQQMS